MVTITLDDRTTIPTIRSVTTSTADFARNSTAFGDVGSAVTVQDGETAFITCRVAMDTYTNDYAYLQVVTDQGTVLGSMSKYRSGYSYGVTTEWKNETGAARTIICQTRKSGSTYGTIGGFTRVLIMNDTDLAKWERVNCPTTRHRKYAATKYYLLTKYTSASITVDGYTADTWGGGITTVDIDTIITSTEITGSGGNFFQITGKGFSVSN
jgi:hypothetical protein